MTNLDKEELGLIVEKIYTTVKTKEIYLFGSFAEGTPTKDSDFDIYVVLEKNEERPIKAIQKINLALSKMNIRSVDILANYSDIFYSCENIHGLEKNIKEKGIKLYERNKQYSAEMA